MVARVCTSSCKSDVVISGAFQLPADRTNGNLERLLALIAGIRAEHATRPAPGTHPICRPDHLAPGLDSAYSSLIHHPDNPDASSSASIKMAPPIAVSGTDASRGPHPSFIETAKPYIFQSQIQECLAAAGISEAKDDGIKLQGIAWIDNVRKALHL